MADRIAESWGDRSPYGTNVDSDDLGRESGGPLRVLREKSARVLTV